MMNSDQYGRGLNKSSRRKMSSCYSYLPYSFSKADYQVTGP